MAELTCVRCALLKATTDFYTNRAKKGGFDCYCKECRRALSRVSMHKYAQVPENRAKMRERDKQRVYTPEQRDRYNAQIKAWALAYPEKRREYERRYRERHPEVLRAQWAHYREHNKETVRQTQRRYHQKPEIKEIHRQRMKLYRKTIEYRIWDNNRCAQRYRDYKKMSIAEWLFIVDVFESSCAYCGKHLPLVKLEMEHMIPRSRGGQHALGNVVPACRSCNAMKHDKTAEEFASLLDAPDFSAKGVLKVASTPFKPLLLNSP